MLKDTWSITNTRQRYETLISYCVGESGTFMQTALKLVRTTELLILGKRLVNVKINAILAIQ